MSVLNAFDSWCFGLKLVRSARGLCCGWVIGWVPVEISLSISKCTEPEGSEMRV